MAATSETYTVTIGADIQPFEARLRDAARAGEQFADKFTQALGDLAVGGATLESSLHSLASSLSRLALEAAVSPLENSMSTLIGSLFSRVTGFASGGVLQGGAVTPFADGGIIGGPTLFALNRGLGLAGEAGPEAILPLERGADGRLGVAASGGGALAINFNVTSPDAESFQRSQAQLATLLHRMVRKGNRNL